MNNIAQAPRRRILVMDDNREIHKDFKKILCDSGPPGGAPSHDETEAFLFGTSAEAKVLPTFEIDSAFQGQEGLELVRRAVRENRRYPVAFVDVRMPPGWDGIETISRVWEVDPDLQVIICTAYSDYSLTGMVAKLGRPDQFVILKKPFDVVEVQQLADAMAAKWDELQKTRRRIGELENSVQERTTELRVSREQAAGLAQEIHQPAHDLADNARFLQDAFAKINHVLQCHAGLLQALKAKQAESELVAQVEQALKSAELDYLVPRIPDVLRESMDRAEAVARIVGAM